MLKMREHISAPKLMVLSRLRWKKRPLYKGDPNTELFPYNFISEKAASKIEKC